MPKFCGSDKQYTDNPQWFDPLGPDSAGKTGGATGGPEARAQIFETMSGLYDQMQGNSGAAGSATAQAGRDPAWGQMANQATATGNGAYLNGSPALDQIFSNYRTGATSTGGVTDATLRGVYTGQNPTGTDANSWRGNSVTQNTLSGKYLNSAPQLTSNVDPMLAGVRARGQAEAADANADVRSQMARNGMGFSTANQQAQISNAAAASARAGETEAATRLAAQQRAEEARLQAYMAERGIQSQTAGAEDAANRSRLAMQAQNYMSERGMQNSAGAAETAAKQRAAEYEAGARNENYGKERLLQSNAANQLADVYGNQLNYLTQANTPQLQTLSQIAQIVQGLAGGGQIATPNSAVVRQPGYFDYGMSAINGVAPDSI